MRASLPAVALLAASCGEPQKSSPSARPDPATSSSVAAGSSSEEAIVISPSGVRGAKPLVGTPEACTAFHACCDDAEKKPTEGLGLACSLAHVAGRGKCEEALKMVRDVITEQNLPVPPGCAAAKR